MKQLLALLVALLFNPHELCRRNPPSPGGCIWGSCNCAKFGRVSARREWVKAHELGVRIIFILVGVLAFLPVLLGIPLAKAVHPVVLLSGIGIQLTVGCTLVAIGLYGPNFYDFIENRGGRNE